MADFHEILRSVSHALDQAILERNQKANLEAALTRACQRRDQETAHLAEYETELRREENNLRSMENMSLRSVVQSLMGKKDEALRSARQRHLQVRHKHARSRQAVTALARQIEDLEQQCAQLAGAEERYQALIEEKESLLLEAQDETAGRLYDLIESLRLARFKIEKIESAVEAGKLVQEGLGKVAAELNDIDPNWEAFGNQLLVKVSRHEHIVEAWSLVRQVEPHLQVFQQELVVVAPLTNRRNETIERFQKVVDAFVLDIRRDAPTPPKIARVVQGAVSIYRLVDEIIVSLTENLTTVQTQIERLSADRHSLIESA